MIRAILFDAEGIVIDTEGAWDASQEEFLGRRGIRYERSTLKPLLSGRTLAEGASIMQEFYKYDGDVACHVDERRALMRDLVSDRVGFIRGFEPFFSKVKTSCAVALATAMDNALFDIVDRRLSLRRLFFNNVVTLQDVQFRSKPNPDLFLCAARKLGVPPAHTAVIEDAPLGITAALNAGMFAIALSTTYDASLLGHADMICSSFEELERALPIEQSRTP